MGILASDDRFNALLDAAVDGIFVISSAGIIEVANEAVERMLGYSREELIGHNIKLLMPSPDREQHDDYLRRHLETGHTSIIGTGREVSAQKKSGEQLQIYLSVGKYEHESNVKFVGILQDLSSLKQVRENLQRAEEEIRDLVNRLAHSSRVGVMGEMAASIAHEVNQPLTAISLYAQAAARLVGDDPDADGDVVSSLQKINDQALRAGDIIHSLRTWIREQDTQREESECNALIQSVVEIVSMEARNNDVEIELDLEPKLPTIVCDPVQIQQVTLNLIKNAIDALAEQDETGSGETRKVRVSSRHSGADRIQVTVQDRGPGVAPEAKEKLFDTFFTTKAAGMGMGLAICRTIIQAHGGTLDFRDNPDGGASFYFVLPTSVAGP